MLKKFGFAVASSAALMIMCGSSSPTDDCDNYVSVYCNKYFQCAATAAALLYGNESACETKVRANVNCATWSCAAGTTYDGSQIESCISAYNNLDCANITQTPSQFQNIQPACK